MRIHHNKIADAIHQISQYKFWETSPSFLLYSPIPSRHGKNCSENKEKKRSSSSHEMFSKTAGVKRDHRVFTCLPIWIYLCAVLGGCCLLSQRRCGGWVVGWDLVHLDVDVDVADKLEGGEEGDSGQHEEEHVAGESCVAQELQGLWGENSTQNMLNFNK